MGVGLYSMSFGPLIPAEVPSSPILSTSLTTQVNAQNSNVLYDASLDVQLTLPSWNGGGGLQEIEVSIGTQSLGAISHTMKQRVNSTGIHIWWSNFTSILTNGAEYTPKARVLNWVGWSDWFTYQTSLIPASIPTAPITSTVKRGDTNVTLYFAAPPTKTGALLHYDIFVYQETQQQQNWSTANSPIILTGLTNGKQYQFVMRAYNWMGIGPNSAPSIEIVPADVPDPVVELLAIPGDMNITVMFQPPNWDGGSIVTSYTIECIDVQNVHQPTSRVLVENIETKVVKGNDGNLTTWFVVVISNSTTPLVNGRKYQINVYANNDVGIGHISTELCWPTFNGLRDWEIALLVIAPCLVILFVMLYIWKCKHQNPITCKKLQGPKSAAVAPEPVPPYKTAGGAAGGAAGGVAGGGAGGGGMFDMSLGGGTSAAPPPTFINFGLEDGNETTTQNTVFDALRTGQAVHVAQKRNQKREQRTEKNRKNRKRRQL